MNMKSVVQGRHSTATAGMKTGFTETMQPALSRVSSMKSVVMLSVP